MWLREHEQLTVVAELMWQALPVRNFINKQIIHSDIETWIMRNSRELGHVTLVHKGNL